MLKCYGWMDFFLTQRVTDTQTHTKTHTQTSNLSMINEMKITVLFSLFFLYSTEL